MSEYRRDLIMPSSSALLKVSQHPLSRMKRLRQRFVDGHVALRLQLNHLLIERGSCVVSEGWPARQSHGCDVHVPSAVATVSATILEPEGVTQRPVVPHHVRGAAKGDDVAVSQRARPFRYKVPVQIRPIHRVIVRHVMQAVRVAHDLRVLTRKHAGHARAIQLYLVEPMSPKSDNPCVSGRLQGDAVRKKTSRGSITDSDERRTRLGLVDRSLTGGCQ